MVSSNSKLGATVKGQVPLYVVLGTLPKFQPNLSWIKPKAKSKTIIIA